MAIRLRANVRQSFSDPGYWVTHDSGWAMGVPCEGQPHTLFLLALICFDLCYWTLVTYWETGGSAGLSRVVWELGTASALSCSHPIRPPS